MSDNFVLIRAYNSEKFIERAVRSAMQNLPDCNIVVVDDGSKDKTVAEVNLLEQDYPDKILLVQQENKGVTGALKTGLKKVSSIIRPDDNFFVLDSDDLFLEPIAEAPEKLKKADICYIPFEMSGEPVSTSGSGSINHNAVVFSLADKNETISQMNPEIRADFTQKIGVGYALKSAKGKHFQQFTKMFMPFYSEKAKGAEDIPNFILPLFSNVKVTGLSHSGYDYVRRADSVTGTEKKQTMLDRLYFLYLLGALIKKNEPTLNPLAPTVFSAYAWDRMYPYFEKRVSIQQRENPNYDYSLAELHQDWKQLFDDSIKQARSPIRVARQSNVIQTINPAFFKNSKTVQRI